jgi:hypothetical protein
MKLTLNPNTVTSVYSGKLGCACGCRGNHATTERSVKLIVSKIQKIADEGGKVEVSFQRFGNQLGYIAAETDTRQYIAYINASEVNA